jgi:hypothetical protein
MMDVSRAQPREPHAEEYVVGTRERVGELLEADNLVPARAGEDDRTHRVTVSRRMRLTRGCRSVRLAH